VAEGDLEDHVYEALVWVPTRFGRILTLLALDRLPSLVDVARGRHRLVSARGLQKTDPEGPVYFVIRSDAMTRGGLMKDLQRIAARLKR